MVIKISPFQGYVNRQVSFYNNSIPSGLIEIHAKDNIADVIVKF